LRPGQNGDLGDVTEHEDHDKLADEMEQEGDRLEQRSAELGDEISETRDDWRRKRADPGVPGAPPPEDDESEEPADLEDSEKPDESAA
jgi:hypothetical protein